MNKTFYMMMKTPMLRATALVCFAGLALASCAQQDEAAKQNLAKSGFSGTTAEQLSTMKLDSMELQNLAQARKAGLDDAIAADMVESMRKRDLKFDIGTDLETMLRQKIGATSLKQLVAMGAVPRWTDDIRALKDAGVNDVTIVEIAKVKFEKQKDVLAGNQYQRMKLRGVSDAALLQFVQNGGTEKQLQKVTEMVSLGKSEQEALKAAGL